MRRDGRSPGGEALIERNLRGLGIAQIVVAHRLTTVRDADRIVVMRDGRVIEHRGHETLARQGGQYAVMVAAADSGSSKRVAA